MLIDVGSLSKKATSLSIPLASLKFPPVTSMSFSNARSKDWDDILTGHEDESIARTWSVPNKRLGKHTFSTASDAGKEATNTLRGAVKVRRITHTRMTQILIVKARQFMLQLAGTLDLSQHPQGQYNYGTCNLE